MHELGRIVENLEWIRIALGLLLGVQIVRAVNEITERWAREEERDEERRR